MCSTTSIWPHPSEISVLRYSANPTACLQVHTRPAPPIAASTCKSHLVFDSQIATGANLAAHSVFDLLSPVSDLFHIWVSWAKLAAPAKRVRGVRGGFPRRRRAWWATQGGTVNWA